MTIAPLTPTRPGARLMPLLVETQGPTFYGDVLTHMRPRASVASLHGSIEVDDGVTFPAARRIGRRH